MKKHNVLAGVLLMAGFAMPLLVLLHWIRNNVVMLAVSGSYTALLCAFFLMNAE